MSNPTSPKPTDETVTITAANGMTFTGKIFRQYEHQGQTFVDINWDAAHGYPETLLTGYQIESLGR